MSQSKNSCFAQLNNQSNILSNGIQKAQSFAPNCSNKIRGNFKFTSILGRRETNEDAEIRFEFKDIVIVAVFDGHNGSQVSKYCKQYLQHFVEQAYQDEKPIEDILKLAIKNMSDSLLCNQDAEEQGCCAVIAAIDVQEQAIHVFNVGDSRCIVGYKTEFKETIDHKPLFEKDRIEKAGGKVEEIQGVYRVNGVLALARSIGDTSHKNKGLISDPDYYNFQLQHAKYILLACDGLFDIFSSKQVDRFIRCALLNKSTNDDEKLFLENYLGKFDNNMSLQNVNGKMIQTVYFENVNQDQVKEKRITQALTKTAYQRGSTDNITAGLCFV